MTGLRNRSRYASSATAVHAASQKPVYITAVPFPLAAWLAGVLSTAVLLPAAAFAHVDGCHTRKCDRRIHEKRREHWKRTHIWEYRWHHISPALKDRLARLRWCESTNNYRASNGSHWGGYQYSWGSGSAGERAGFRVRPDYASPREQDVRTAWFFPSHAGEWECRA